MENEPKFKVGDYVFVIGRGDILKILEVRNARYFKVFIYKLEGSNILWDEYDLRYVTKEEILLYGK